MMKINISFFLSILAIPCIIFSQNQIEITSFYAKVYLAPNFNSKFIGLAQRGEVYSVLNENNSWYQIKFKVSIGWVNSNDIKLFDPNAKASDTIDSAIAIQVSENDSLSTDTLQTEKSDSLKPAINDISNIEKSESSSVYSGQPTQTVQTPTSEERKRQTAAISEEKEEKPKSKIRDWFTKQNPFKIEPATEEISVTEKINYFQVTFAPARILQYLSPDSPILGMAKKGDTYPLIGEGESWCKIVFADTIGWIESKNGKIVDAPSSILLSDLLLIGIIAGVFLIISIIIIVIFRIRRKNNSDLKEITVKKNVLFIAKAGKLIQNTFGEKPTSLDKCFAEIGFNVAVAKNLPLINSYLQQNFPDVVMVDWKFDKNIINTVERIFSSLKRAQDILIITYNVPDPSMMQPSRVLPKMNYLGLSFSDRDIFKLVTPQITVNNAQNIKKSVKSSALEGETDGENLLEVLQFIETGRKTGCMLVETDKPFGLIYFNMGRIIYVATSSGIYGKDAVFAILNLKQGKFRFVLNKKPKRNNVNLSTLEVLMEWTKAIDEAHGN